MTHIILSFNPFTVKYVKGSQSVLVRYPKILMPEQVRLQYPFVEFMKTITHSMSVSKYKHTLLLMDGHNVICELPNTLNQ